MDISHTAQEAERLGFRAVRMVALAVLLGVLQGADIAQPAGSDLVSARSHSGQFVVYAGRFATTPPPIFGLATNQNFIRL